MQQKYKFPYAFSGLVDTRNAESFEGSHYPNVDMLYGVYSSKQDAWDTLSADNAQGINALVVGRTVGIKVNGRMVEYWFEKACETIDDLVEKRVSVIDVALEPADGEEFTNVEKMALYVAFTQSPKGSMFVGIDNEGNKFTLNVSETPRYIVVSYIDGDTIQRMTISKETRDIECSYTSYQSV